MNSFPFIFNNILLCKRFHDFRRSTLRYFRVFASCTTRIFHHGFWTITLLRCPFCTFSNQSCILYSTSTLLPPTRTSYSLQDTCGKIMNASAILPKQFIDKMYLGLVTIYIISRMMSVSIICFKKRIITINTIIIIIPYRNDFLAASTISILKRRFRLQHSGHCVISTITDVQFYSMAPCFVSIMSDFTTTITNIIPILSSK